MKRVVKRNIRNGIIFVAIGGIIVGGIYYCPKLFNKEKVKDTPPIKEIVKTEEERITEKYSLENYSAYYKLDDEHFTIIKDNIVNFIDTKNDEIGDINSFIKDKEHLDLVIDRLIHQKYNMTKADELRKKERLYTFKEHELLINFDEYNSEDNLNVDYNLIKDYLLFNPVYNESYEIEDCYELDPNKITVALTFDDGPAGNKTVDLINFLEKNNVSATFFMKGKTLTWGKTAVLRVNNSHSEIGYHSYNHEYFTKQKVETIKEEYEISSSTLFDLTANTYAAVRPPYGSYNDDVREAIDLPFVTWNLDTNDWKYRDAENAKDYVLTHYKDGGIILMHDIHASSVEGVKLFIPLLKEKGVQITSVSRLAKLKGIKLENHEVYKSFS